MRYRERNDLPLTADINVTSLVDVAFTLLVIFIITAPALQGGIELDIPEADAPPITVEDQPFIVSIKPDGTVVAEQTELSEEEFRGVLAQLLAAAQPERVVIRGDAALALERFLQVLGIVHASGARPLVQTRPWQES